MYSLSFTLLSLIASAAAVPSVTPVPLVLKPDAKPTCSHWPNWIRTPDADTTGYLTFKVSGSDDPAVNGLPAQPMDISFGGKIVPMLGIELRASTWFAKMYYRCSNGQAITHTFDNLTISKDSNNAHILVNGAKEASYLPELYAHEIDGVRQDGAFLGAMNRTTWGFAYHEAKCGADGSLIKDYYEAKLLDLPVDEQYPPTAGYEPWFKGFLKVDSW